MWAGGRVAAPSIRCALLAYRWPRPQQLLAASAAGGARRRCSRLRCCSNPPAYVSLTFAQKKTASVSLHQRFFHGRGWIRTTEAEKQQIYSLSPLATREHAQILFTSVAGRLVYFIRLRAICQLLFSDFCSFSAEAVGRVSFGSDVSGARNPARRQWLRRTWGIGQ